MQYRKVYVEMNLNVRPDGSIRPVSMRWIDGNRYSIDRLLYVTPAASLKVGGQGMRYTVMIEGKERWLFCEDGRWFVEAEVAES